MPGSAKTVEARFYQSPSGSEPVRDWLKALAPQDRKVIGIDIATIEYSWPVGMPHCRPLGGGLWEVRSAVSDGRIARVIFSLKGDDMVLLHGFIKKSQKTPSRDLDLARARLRELS